MFPPVLEYCGTDMSTVDILPLLLRRTVTVFVFVRQYCVPFFPRELAWTMRDLPCWLERQGGHRWSIARKKGPHPSPSGDHLPHCKHLSVTCPLYVFLDKSPPSISLFAIMSERPRKKAKVSRFSNPRRGVTSLIGGTQSTSTAGPKFQIFSGGNYTEGRSVVFDATDDEQGSERQTPTPSMLPPTEEILEIEGMNELHLDMNMDNSVLEDTILPTLPRRSKKVCQKTTGLI
jgi:hypothetical protein